MTFGKRDRKNYYLAYRERNRQRLREYLSTHPCVICGEAEIIYLEFDHIDPKTKYRGISDMVSGTAKWESILEEIAKCQVLCVKCHRKKTIENGDFRNSRNSQEFIGENRFAGCSQLGQAERNDVICPPSSWLHTRTAVICIDCGAAIGAASIRCSSCDKKFRLKTKIAWPSIDALEVMARQSPLIHLAKTLGVTDNAVRKHFKKHGKKVPVMPWNMRSKNKYLSS